MYNNGKDNIQYWVTLAEKGSVKMECGNVTAPYATVAIPIDMLFELTRSILKSSSVVHNYVSSDVLSDIHDYT